MCEPSPWVHEIGYGEKWRTLPDTPDTSAADARSFQAADDGVRAR